MYNRDGCWKGNKEGKRSLHIEIHSTVSRVSFYCCHAALLLSPCAFENDGLSEPTFTVFATLLQLRAGPCFAALHMLALGVRSCKFPFSSKLVTPAGKFPGGGDVPVAASDWNVARNPTVAPVGDRKLDSERTSLTPLPPPSPVMAPMLVICLLKSNVLAPVTLPTLRLEDST